MALKRLPIDFKEFIECLNNHKVRYLLVGGWAVGLYGNPRATKDIDFLISIEEDNIKQLQSALQEFGAPTVDDAVFIEKGNVFRMGNSRTNNKLPPNQKSSIHRLFSMPIITI